MKFADTVAAIVASLVGLGVVVAFTAKGGQGPAVIQDTFSGAGNVFGTILSPVGATQQH